jgi:cobalamin synthase
MSMRSAYDRAVAAERSRNAMRDPRSGTYGRSQGGMAVGDIVQYLVRTVRSRPLSSLLLAKVCGVVLGLALAGALASGDSRRRLSRRP